ncbi:MAG: hypothetical protein NTV54_01755, partial [Ignavibacteriales bacterium]|nr:hypothetical protein [Ignavibacteriales bacterium]
HGNMMALIPLVLGNTFTIVEGNVPSLPVTEDAQLARIPYVETVTRAKSETSLIGTLILPVKDQKEAEAICGSASISSLRPDEVHVSIVVSSENREWLFAKDKGGYVLKK